MNPLLELPSGKGFADVVYLPKRDVDRPALAVELKWDKSARGGDILLVGINYKKKEKIHECMIEEYCIRK